MEIAIGVLLCISLLTNIILCVGCYILYKLYNSNEKVITDICKIEDNLTEMKEYLGQDFEEHHKQN